MKRSKKNSEDSVYRKIKGAIRKRYIKQGSQLVEIALAQQLGVSRTPVRSAIKRLESEGLVSSVPNKGAFVITPTLREIEETFQVRAQLEKMAARLTARSITKKQLNILQEMIDTETVVFDKNNLDEYFSVNDRLHQKIAEFSGNRVLCTYVRELLDKTRIYLILYDPFFKLEYSPTAEHQKIIDALKNGSPKEAGKAVEKHVKSSTRGLETTAILPEDYLSI